MRLFKQYSSPVEYRKENYEKIDLDYYSWYSYFHAEEFCWHPTNKEIYEAYLQIDDFDFDKYTYILSFGFTIEQLLYKGNYDQPKLRQARVVHGTGCSANSILLYRIPKIYLEPFSDRRDNWGYKFILN